MNAPVTATRTVTLVGGPGDGRTVDVGTSSRYRVPDLERGTRRRGGYPLVDYRRERVGFVMPPHLEATVRAGLSGLELERRELVNAAGGEHKVHLETEIWATDERLDAIRVELALVDKALGPLAFVELYDDSLFSERLKRKARAALERLAELMSPGHVT